MKYTLLLVSLLILIQSAFAQKKKKEPVSFYVFDAAWKPCNIEDAAFLGSFESINDTTHQWKYYHFSGPLLSIETYRDKEGTIPNGYFSYFDENGLIDSSGYTFNGKKDKEWYYFSDTLSIWQIDEYDKGKLIKRKDSTALRIEREENNAIGLLPGEKEADFKGGIKGWINFLQKNLEFPDRAYSLKKDGKIMIQFTVNTDGSLYDFKILQSKEYSLDNEAMRLLKVSPKWNPAIQAGHLVKAYRRQPFTFQL